MEEEEKKKRKTVPVSLTTLKSLRRLICSQLFSQRCGKLTEYFPM